MNIEKQNLNQKIGSIVVIGVILVLAVVIFEYLGDIGTSNGLLSETIQFESQTERINVPINSLCDIVSVTDINGDTLSPSEYEINNCEVTYTP